MTTANRQSIFIRGADIGGLTAAELGKLSLRKSDPTPSGAFRVLDCFDGTVRKSGALLIATGGQLVLYRPDGSVVEQEGGDAEPRFVADLPDGPVKAGLGKVSPLRSLIPVGAGRMTAQDLTVVDDQEKTHARADIRILYPDGDGTAVTLVAIEGLRGYHKAFHALVDGATAVNGIGGLTAVQAADLLCPNRADYDPKPDIAIGDDEPAFDVATRVIATYLPVARANEPGTIADYDTEFLHDYRVALRKIRSVISLFRGVYSDEQTAWLKGEFSDLMAVTGRLRDLDVYLLEKDTYFELLPPSLHPGLDLMFKRFAVERAAKHRALVKHLKSAAYAKRMAALEKRFAAPKRLERGPNADLAAHDYASSLIWSRYRKACKIARGIGPDTDDEDVHELRIRCKKLRYLMEFFASLYPADELNSLIKPLKKLQDNLGLFNDYSVQQISLQTYLDSRRKPGSADQTEQAKSIGALIAILHDRQVAERAKVVSSFARFDSEDTRDTFRRLFKQVTY